MVVTDKAEMDGLSVMSFALTVFSSKANNEIMLKIIESFLAKEK